MRKSEYDLRQCFVNAGKAFLKNVFVVLLIVAILPLPGFVLWMEAPLPILCIELTLLDCFYLLVVLLLIYGMFGSVSENISITRVLSPFLKPVELWQRCMRFYYSEPIGILHSVAAMILGIVFGLGAQWLAAPWKIPAGQNLIGALIYAACLLIWSQHLVLWMLQPYYLAHVGVDANEAFKRSQVIDHDHKSWSLRFTAILALLLPVLLFGIIRYMVLKPADFENYQLDLRMNYLLSIVPWMLSVFGLFVWNEIYRQRVAQPSGDLL